jgi:hypothetical protein
MMAKNSDFIASIVTKVNESGSEVLISADKINLEGSTFVDKITASTAFISYLSGGEANIKGNITATSGSIGGWTIDEDKLYSNEARASIRMNLDRGNLNRQVRLGGTEINARDAMLWIRNDAGTCAEFSSYGDNSKALSLLAQAGSNTFALESYGNVKFGLRPSNTFTFFDPNGDGRKSNSTGKVDFRVPITFNGVANCKYGGTLYLPAQPSNGMFFFAKWCKVYANGHEICEPNGTSTVVGKNGYYNVVNESSIFVYSEETERWIAFYCG